MNILKALYTSLPLSGLALLFMGIPAAAQNFNIDFADNVTLGTPSSTYGAASGQAGFWNDCIGNMPLADISGAATGVSIALVGVDIPYGFDELCTAGDDQALMDDIMYTTATTGYFSITGLSDGSYQIYTYAMAPDSNAFLTDVTVIGSPDGTQAVGGDFCLGFVHLATHAIHNVDVVGGNAQIDVAVNLSFTSLNGMQIIQTAGGSAGTAYCFGDPGSCPCNNNGSADSGCANGSGAGGVLGSSGSNSIASDDLVLSGSGLIANQPGLYFQGNNAINAGSGIQFGDGLRCAGGGVIRLQVRFAGGAGASSTTANLVVTGGVVPGDTKRYQLWYRDPGSSPCGALFNLTNGIERTFQA